MKKLFILLLALASFVWAEIEIEMAVRIESFPENLFFDSDDMNKEDYEACSTFYKGKEHGYNDAVYCGYEGLCRSMLDSNILLGWNGGYISFFDGVGSGIEFYVLTGANHTVKEIIEDEFIRYRKCYYFTDNDSIFDSLFAEIDSILVPEINKYKKNEGKQFLLLLYNYGAGWVRPAELAIDGGGSDLFYYYLALDSVNARNAAISGIAPAKYKLESIRVQNHQLSVSPELLGRKFTLFDVNGHELRRGTLQNNMQLPAYPTVIKIQGFGTKLLNSH